MRKSKVKGAEGERELCKVLGGHFPGSVFERNLKQSREGGCDIPFRNFMIEVKRRKFIAVHKWMRQAINASGVEKIPVVAMRGDNQEWLVAVRLTDAARLIQAGGGTVAFKTMIECEAPAEKEST